MTSTSGTELQRGQPARSAAELPRAAAVPVPAHEVIRIPACGDVRRDELKQQCFDVRIEVFVREQGYPLELEIDNEDENAAHFLLRLLPSLKPVGAIRAVTIHPPRRTPPTSEGPSAPPPLPAAPFLRTQPSSTTSPPEQSPYSPSLPPSKFNDGKHSDHPAVTDTEALTLPGSDEVYYKLGRLAVLKDYRQFGFGRLLVLAVHNWVQQEAARTMSARKGDANHPDTSGSPTPTVRIVSHSQLPVMNFYAKYGYKPEGDVFDEDGEPHQKMVAHLPVPVLPSSDFKA